MLETIWQDLLVIIEQEVGVHVVHTWLKSICIQQWDKSLQTVYLKTPNKFVQTWVKDNYIPLLEQHLKRLFNVKNIKVCFDEKTNNDIQAGIQPATSLPIIKHSYSTSSKVYHSGVSKKISLLNSLYSFDNFVVGPSNELSYAACKAVSLQPSKIYNPLFMYGKSGVGKTHLLHAVGTTIKTQYPESKVMYQTTDRFLTEFISAIRLNKVEHFKAHYKNIDVLLIDDIQFIANKEQTQEIFFHIFNILHDAHKQIILSSDTDPAGINGLAERLRSRFCWGLVTDIGVPTLETKIAILQKKIALNNYLIPQQVVEYIAAHGAFNIRELEGALIRIVAYAALNQSPIDLELVQRIILPLATCSDKPALSLKHIAKTVYKHLNISLIESRSQKRTRNLVIARQLSMYLAKKLTSTSLEKIGEHFGGKNHTTVLHAINKITLSKKNDTTMSTLIKVLEQELIG